MTNPCGPKSPASPPEKVVRNREKRTSESGATYEYIIPVNRVAKKVRTGGRSLEEIEESAEEVVEELAEQYETALNEQIDELNDLAQRLPDTPEPDRTAVIADMRRIGHNVKGHAGSFGYPLVGEVADLLNRVLYVPDMAKFESVVRSHVDTLALILHQDIRDRDDARGNRLYQELSALLERLGIE